MRPLHLDITGLRSFRAKQTLDFTDLSLFAVIGDTGAGKSSILEAIVFALYNASTWDARGGGALMSQDADAMTVVFDFAVGGKRYRVNRTVFRNTRPALHALRSPDDPDYRFDGERVVTTEIRRLIGLDYDTFSKTVVLPQGRFAELLTARETDRVKVLTELLGLDEIDRLRDKLEPARQEADGHKRETLAARAALGGDPAAEAQRRVEAERAARASLAAVAAAREELRAKAAARSRVAERLSAFDAVERACAELVPAAQTIREVVPEHDRLQTELNALTEQRAQTRSELAAADRGLQELVKNRRDVASIVTFTGDVGRLRSELQFLASQALEFEERERALQAEEEALKSGREALKALQAKAAGAQSALAAAERHREEIRERGEGARDAWRSWAQASSALASARNALEANEGQRSESAARCAEFEAAEVAAAAAYESARIAYEQAERVDRAAALAHELHAGDPCPVCRRELPTEFVAPAAPDVAAAKRALQSAERARDKARREHEKSRAGLEALEVRRAECDTTLAAKLREHESAERALLAVGLAPTAEGEDEALAPLRAEFVAAVAAFHAAQEVRETERSAFDRADAELRARSKAQADAFKTHQTSVRARERRLEQTERLRQGLPEAYRPAAAAEEEAFARILGALEAARAAADEAAVKQKTLAANATDVERKLGAAQTAHQRTVSDVATSGRHALERALSAMGGALEVCELAAAPVRMGDDFAQLVSWCEPLLSWSQETRAVVVARRREMSAQGAALDAAIAAILLAQEVETTEAFERRYVDKTADAAVAVERVAVARTQAERAAKLDRELSEFEPIVSALGHLSKYLQNRSFKDFVMRRRERRLLGIGTEILRGMTGGRYAFAERFEILDSHTNRTRSAKTLSGGETFLASLALALALVEVASRTGGKLDALFLDEGFGNLDAAAFDDALAELSERAKGGKLIGIVTHVRGIAEQIDTILRVERRAGGSVIERLEGSELAAFMEDEVRTGLLKAAGG